MASSSSPATKIPDPKKAGTPNRGAINGYTASGGALSRAMFPPLAALLLGRCFASVPDHCWLLLFILLLQEPKKESLAAITLVLLILQAGKEYHKPKVFKEEEEEQLQEYWEN